MRIYVPDHRTSKKRIQYCKECGIGLLYTPKYNQIPRCHDFIIDNGAFEAWQQDKEWDGKSFLKYCDMINNTGKIPYFVTIPDIVAGGVQSLELSAEYISFLPKGWPKYLAVQNGMEIEDIKNWVETYNPSGLFIGGTIRWKWRNTWILARHAHKWGLKCHVGRIGNKEGYEMCNQVGVDSVDGSTPIRHDKLHIIPEWVKDHIKQARLLNLEQKEEWLSHVNAAVYESR